VNNALQIKSHLYSIIHYSETPAKKIEWKYSTKQINKNKNKNKNNKNKNRNKNKIKKKNNNNDVPKGTNDKVYSTVISSNNKCCLMMAHVWPKYVAMTSNVHIYDI
jgi:hypothetical protein